VKLLVVSHTPHYRQDGGLGGGIVGFGPTVRELDRLATLCERIWHLAPLHPGPPPPSALPYESPVELLPIAPTGGDGVAAKGSILLAAPSFWRRLASAVRAADVVHVRAPANVAWLAMIARPWLAHRPWWVKYAGNWRPELAADAFPEAFSYRRQRAWCARPRRELRVTVNGRWPDQPPHVRTFRNPSFDAADLKASAAAAASKRLAPPWRLLFVGRVEEPKGADRAVEVLARVRAQGLDAELDVVGDGPLRAGLPALAARLGVGNAVRVHGELPRPAVAPLYAAAHWLLLPSRSSEGWPKVLSEAMAWGAVPLAGAVSGIPQMLGELGTGRALPPRDVGGFAAAIVSSIADPERLAAESRRAVEAAGEFTYDRYLTDVGALIASFEAG
jgi:glycosyltransferase involved in cell wall biosynthesis